MRLYEQVDGIGDGLPGLGGAPGALPAAYLTEQASWLATGGLGRPGEAVATDGVPALFAAGVPEFEK